MFTTNAANNRGGAINLERGSATVITCDFTGNAAGAGRAFYTLDGDSEVLNCRFWNNDAVLRGAIGTKGGVTSVINCSVSGNTASDSAGGIWTLNSYGMVAAESWRGVMSRARAESGVTTGSDSPHPVSDLK